MSIIDELTSPLPAAPEPNYLFKLSGRVGEASEIPEAERKILSEVLLLVTNFVWTRSKWRNFRAEPPFAPHYVIPPRRSFLPGDLRPEDVEAVRRWAGLSKNLPVRARLYDVLWVRTKNYADAQETIDALLALQAQHVGDDDWQDLVETLGRAGDLSLSINDKSRLTLVVHGFETAKMRLLGGANAHGFANLAAAYLGLFARIGRKRGVVTDDDFRRWGEAVDALAEQQFNAGDVMLAEWSGELAVQWHVRLRDKVSELKAAENHVERLLRESARSPAARVPMVLERALAIAKAHCPAAMGRVLARLHPAIRRSAEALPLQTFNMHLDGQLVGLVRSVVDDSESFAECLHRLAMLEVLTAPRFDDLQAEARKMQRTSPLFRLINSVSYGDGKIRHRGNTEEEKFEEALGMIFGLYLAQVDGLLHLVLQFWSEGGRTFEGLLGALGSPTLRPERIALLRVAAERFSAQDWVSSVVLACIVYEAVLRDELRARCDYAALRSEPDGSQKDETLNSLLAEPKVQAVLGVDHAKFVGHVLCQARIGPNLRNEVAHGTVNVHQLSGTRALLVWLFLVRLVAVPLAILPADVEPTKAPAGGASGEASEESSEEPPLPERAKPDLVQLSTGKSTTVDEQQ